MVTAAYLALLAAVGVERLFELRLSRRNARRALANGGIECGAGHYRFMKALHLAFLVACGAEVVLLGPVFHPVLGGAMFGAAALAQALRYWSIWTLGDRWNVRVIVVPGAPVVTSGPYRFVRHPNYAAVAIEGVALPMIHTAWLTALCFTLANAALLTVRIGSEERALAHYTDYRAALGDRARFLPAPGARR
jgi:methyltransferase